jgi:hypothetical protein
MSTEATTQSWLELAEEERGVREMEADLLADSLADEVNTLLATLGITPLTPATTDGKGNVVAAQLTEASLEKKYYSVHADFDEDEGKVDLFVGDFQLPSFRQFRGLRPTGFALTGRDAASARDVILKVRENGPLPQAGPLSSDMGALVEVLQDIHEALQDIYRHGIGQV